MRIKTNHQHVKTRYFERSLRYVISLIYFFIFLTFLFQRIYYEYGLAALSTTQWVVLGGGYLLLVLLEVIEGLFYPRKPILLLAIFLTGIRFIIYLAINLYDPTGISSSILGYILFTLCFYIHPIIVLPVLLLILLIFYQNISLFWMREDVEIGYIYEFISFVLFYLFGFIIRMDDKTRLNNQKMILQLEEYASNSNNLGRQEERNRISRDLHDSLGHQLVAVNIQLQKAIAYRDINSEDSLQSMQLALGATNQAMGELRQTIDDLRDTETLVTIEQEMDSLIQSLRDLGLEVNYNLTGKSKGYSALILFTLRQIVQEGLTNIQKHAEATHVDVTIAFQMNKISVKIKDNGRGFHWKKALQQGHYGLLGMQERLDLIGGRLKIKSKPNQGTVLMVNIPKRFSSY